MATEVELKLYCSPDDIARVTSHPLIAGGREIEPRQRLENTYYDTRDLALHNKRIAVRIRTTASEQLQTVKCAAKSLAGLSTRPEWETPYAGAFDFSGIEARKVRNFLEAASAHLLPVFTTHFERRTWRVEISKKIAVLVMVDIGEVSSGGQSVPISEVEIELAQGSPEDVLDFATALASHLPLIPHDVSKAERGYRLFLAQANGPRKAQPSPLQSELSTAEAFRLLAEHGMQNWQANLFGVVTTREHEFIHQFRVSLRRLNSLLKTFQPALPHRFQTKWTERLKAQSQITGDARDLDVMQASILAPLRQSPDPKILAHVESALAALSRAREDAFGQMAQLHYGGLLLLFSRDLLDMDRDGFPKNLPRFAEKQLAGLHRNALKRLVKTLRSPTPQRAHRFRIALKHLRYACEFFAPLFDNDEMLNYARAIAGLQDALGFINDFHVALSRLQHWVDAGHIALETREAIATWHTPHAQATLSDALQGAESVMSRCQPWCTECERRGLASIRRRMRHDLKLQVE